MNPMNYITAADIIGLLIIFYVIVGICTICRINIYRHMDYEFTVEEKIWIFIQAPRYIFSAFPGWVRMCLRHERGFIIRLIHILSFFNRMSEFSDKYVFRIIKQIEDSGKLVD